MPRGFIVAFMALLSGLVVFSSSSTEASPRPPSELSLFLRLNGEPRRWVMPDGGASGLFASAKACMPIAKGGIYLFDSSGIALCMGQTAYWDGGCLNSAAVTELNGGKVIPEGMPYYLVTTDDVAATLEPSATVTRWAGGSNDKLVCGIQLDGGAIATPVFRLE